MLPKSKLSSCFKLLLTTLLFVNSSHSVAEDEIFIATLEQDKVVNVVNISKRAGYDNQPHFTTDSKALLYTAMFVDGDSNEHKLDDLKNSQTDSMRFDINTGLTVNLTQSKASEYSPTVMPSGNEFSVIYVGADGRQRFSSYPLSGGKATSLVSKLDKNFGDIGYHVWLNTTELLMFVLAEPMQLQRVDLASGNAQLIDTDIGRTLRKVPNKNVFSYNKAREQQWQMHLFNPNNNTTEASVTLPQDNMYYAWHNDGRLISADGTKLMVNSLLTADTKWQAWHDFSESCHGSITRLVMSQNSKYIAFVCNTTA